MIEEKIKTLSDINQLLETLKLVYKDDETTCDLESHITRLRKSIRELGFVDIGDIEKLKESVLKFNPQCDHFKQQETSTDESLLSVNAGLRNERNEVFSDFGTGSNNRSLLHNLYSTIIRLSIKLLLCKGNKQLYRVRILYNRNGSYEVQHIPYAEEDIPKIIKLKILDYNTYHINSSNPIHKYKYLPRTDFSEYLKDCDEVLWLNERHEICEGSKASIFFFDGMQWHTPSLKCGILPSITRERLIKKYNAKEGFYKIDDLLKAKKIIRTSAVIGERECILV